MNLTVFGATGATGVHVVKQALAAGDRVTAVVRDPRRLAVPADARLDVINATVLEPAAIAPSLSGRDVVISTLGSREKGPTTVCRTVTTAIIAAMRDAGISRLVVVSNSGNYTDGDGVVERALVKPLLRRVLRHAFADMDAMENAVRASGLDWTIVRPPQLTDHPYTGKVRSRLDGNVRGGFRIPRADLAHYLLRAAREDMLVHKTASVAH